MMGLRLGAFVGHPDDAAGGYRVVDNTQWHPTVAVLILMVIVELFIFGSLRYYFRSAHGG